MGAPGNNFQKMTIDKRTEMVYDSIVASLTIQPVVRDWPTTAKRPLLWVRVMASCRATLTPTSRDEGALFARGENYMHIDQRVVVVVGDERHQGIITRLPGKVPRSYTTGTGEWPYYGIIVLSASGKPVLLYFLTEEITLQ